MIKTYATSLHRRFLTSRVVLYCMKSCGLTDGMPEGPIVPPDMLDVKTELPLSLNLGCSILLVFSRLFFLRFLVFSGYAEIEYSNPHPDSPSFRNFSFWVLTSRHPALSKERLSDTRPPWIKPLQQGLQTV